MLNGASILVTGGTGSFARAFVARVLKEDPKRLVILSRDEQKQEQMARDFQHESLRFFLGDVRDSGRLELAMRGIDIVIHAAALKIIPSCEYNPFETIHTNIIGAENVIRAAIKSGSVSRVVALSTDKACSPINLYGATKLAAEKLFVTAKYLSAGLPLFSVVRYGNVVGSRGSVIPLFSKLAREGKALPITDLRMTRFWITLESAVAFVLDSLKMMRGGEVFVPKIPSMKVVDLAKAVWGVYHSTGVPTEVVGIRVGEKLHETLLTVDEARNASQLASRFIINGDNYAFAANGLPEGYYYSSDNNTEWLGIEQLRSLISD